MIQLKPFRQSPTHCGPAVLKMVLEYYGVYKTEKALAKSTKHTYESGITAENLLKSAKRFGCTGFIKDNADIKDIQEWVKKGVPVIVDWFSIDEGHYSIAVEVTKDMIYLQDPQLGHPRAIKLDEFKRIWFDFEPTFMKTKDDLLLRRMIVILKKK